MLEKHGLPTHMFQQTYWQTICRNFDYISKLNDKRRLYADSMEFQQLSEDQLKLAEMLNMKDIQSKKLD